jgi:uncharacterized protein YijF (DUF1287 family)
MPTHEPRRPPRLDTPDHWALQVVADQIVPGRQRPRIIHNIGAGPVEDDILFSYPITVHFRYPK